LKKKGIILLSAVLLLVVSLVFAGCSQPNGEGGTQAPDSGNEQAEQPDDQTQETTMIQIRGSDSEVNLVQRLAEEFMNENPHVQIAVTGGGSGVGISSIIDGTVDIANSSRVMKDEEIEQAKANGIDPVPVRFSVDGIAVIVNENNPVNDLTVDELGAIYRGEVGNWSEVGGEDKKINLYGRQSNSGTYVFFMESVLKGDYSPEMRNMGGNADIVEAVSNDETGVGYVAIGYTMEEGSVRPGIKVLNIAKDSSTPATTPLELDNILNGAYPITRPLYQFIKGQPEGAIKDFVEFEISERGQQIVLEQGFYPLRAEDIEANNNSLQ